MKHKYFGLITAAALVLTVFAIDITGFLDGANAYFYDLFFRMRGDRHPGDEIVVVGIDDKSLAQLGRWPIERRHYVCLLEHLSAARVVGFNILMPESSGEDGALKDAFLKHGRVVLPIYLGQDGLAVQPDQLQPGIPYGHVHVEQGLDGITRDVYHSVTCCGLVVPSFASAVHERASSTHGSTTAPVFIGSSPGHMPGAASWTDPMLINFYGPGKTFLHVSMVDVLSGTKPGDDFFRDRIVLVGPTAPGIAGEVLTPFAEGRGPMSGVEQQANIVANLLYDTRVVPVTRECLWFSVLILSVAGIFFFPHFFAGLLALVWLFTLVVVMATLFWLFSRLDLYVPAAPFVVCVTGAAVVAYIYHLKTIQRSLYFSERDWEESFNTIEDAIVIHDDHCAVVKANWVASERLGSFMLDLIQERCSTLKVLHHEAAVPDRCKGHDRESKASPSSTQSPGRFSGICSWLSLLSRKKIGVSKVLQLSGVAYTRSEQIWPEEVLDVGSDHHYEVRSHLRYDKDQAFGGVVHVIRDITERKRHEKEQQELQSMLVQAQKLEAIGMLAGGIAHDFNNILASIMGYAELAYYQARPESSVREKIEEVLNASKRARDIISQILIFTKHTSQENRLFKVGEVVAEAIKLIRVTLPATIEIRVDIRTSASMCGDPAQIYQVLLNLCTNAYHAMKNGGTLVVSLEDMTVADPIELNGLVLQPGRCVHLSVSDTGHGIPEELRHKVFEPFFSTKPQGEGTGLGLSTVRGVVQELAGAITFETEAGHGTTFHIYAPIPDEQATAPEAPVEAPTATGEGHILLLDDDPSITDLVREMLKSFGYQVTAMNSPVEALRLFQEKPEYFDLIITDMAMPKMSGEEFAAKVVEIKPDIPIVLCTGFADKGLVERLRSKGVHTLLQKPFRMSLLSETIQAVICR